jgi:hypothetical protein
MEAGALYQQGLAVRAATQGADDPLTLISKVGGPYQVPFEAFWSHFPDSSYHTKVVLSEVLSYDSVGRGSSGAYSARVCVRGGHSCCCD